MTSLLPAARRARSSADGSRRQAARAPGFLLLVADPDLDKATVIAEALAEHHVSTIVCADGAEALLTAGAEHPDAVLAAARLPTIGGAALTRTLHARTDIPVVLGVGDGDGRAAAEGLAAGATACVAHPYRLRELLPILRAIRPESVPELSPPLEYGGLRLDPASLEVHLRGQLVRMPMRELRLLQLLMTNADRVVTREQIRDSVWGGVRASNTITVHVQRLRQRLGDDHADPKLILTVRGVGYRLVPPSPVSSPARP
jgi:DNA-binding response OmpR family regulator